MIIGVDAGSLSIHDDRLKVGVYRVTYNLLKALSQIDHTNTYKLYSFIPISPEVLSAFGDRMINVVLRPSIGWMKYRMPIELRLHPVDVFLGLSQAIPTGNVKSIGFIYDLGFLYNPLAYGKHAIQLKHQTDNVIRRSQAIVTISEASKIDIHQSFSISQNALHVCYPGVSKLFTQKGPKETTFGKYILFVGSLNKAKDIPLALRTFACFKKLTKIPYKYVLVGGDFWPDKDIQVTIRELKLEQDVIFAGYVPDADLPRYYRGADAFFTTALREGFCLPAAESMACGTPVVAVDRGAMKEIVRTGGLVVNSLKTEDVAQALIQVVSQSKTRQQMIHDAPKIASLYTWNHFASCVYDLYRYGYKTK